MFQPSIQQVGEFIMKKWYRGYIWLAVVMIIPSMARMNSAPTQIDGLFFYVVSVAVWGTALSAILYAWDRFQSSKSKE